MSAAEDMDQIRFLDADGMLPHTLYTDTVYAAIKENGPETPQDKWSVMDDGIFALAFPAGSIEGSYKRCTGGRVYRSRYVGPFDDLSTYIGEGLKRLQDEGVKASGKIVELDEFMWLNNGEDWTNSVVHIYIEE